jgi:hypothetical protein
MRRVSRIGVVTVIGCLVAAGGAALPASASGGSSLVQESFLSSTTTSPNWLLPGGAENDACLVDSSDTSQTPIPGCAGSAGSESGLQLTTDTLGQEGGIAYGLSVPTSQGLDVTFDTRQYDEGDALYQSGADGIAFFLAGSDPSDPASTPVTLGPVGGNLGYTADGDSDADGLSDAYLGVGLDAYGNFTNPIGSQYTNPVSQGGCGETPTFEPEHLDVRGPGNGQSGYCLLDSVPTGGLDTNDYPYQAVPVEVAVNPSASTLTTASGLTVAADSYAVSIVDESGTTDTTSGSLPDASAYLPSGWLDSSGVPKQLTFGWTAATGSVVDYHDLLDVSVSSLIGTPPQLGVSLSDTSGGTGISGQTVTYTASTQVTAADENDPITLTDTFPSGLTPQTTGLGGTGWSCGVTGQTVSCTSATPVAAGTTLSAAMPVVVSVPSGSSPLSLPDTVTVSSDDANPSNATDTETYSAAPSATTLGFTNEPVDSVVNTAMLNPDSSQTHVRVAAELTPGGTVDTSYSGPVTLAFKNNPDNAEFVVNGTPSATMTAQASKGVADFSPVIVNAVGFSDTLTATATGLTAAVSTAFDVNAAQTVCASGASCTTTTSSPGTGQSATVTEAAGSGSGTVTATFGGNVAPIHPCTSSAPGILTFSGSRQKTITLTITTKKPILLFCYGQPTPFLDVLLHKTTYFNKVNQDFEGLLPPCLPRLTGPCVKSLTLTKTTETVKILSGVGDPHLSH